MDPMGKKKQEAKVKSAKTLGKLGVKDLDLNEYEEVIATEVILPSDLKVGFKEVGGLETIIDSLKETVIYPLMYPQLFSSASGLLGAPKGVLLYGPPGCGKTMLAKALASESGATFINLHVSTLTEKWFGESQKLVRGLFSLARKLQPCIIFIDEIDSFLRERRSGDHEATSMMKAEFMSLWDGLATADNRILILGATNRPNDIDKAILRRMPKRFAIKLPDTDQRSRILRLLLSGVQLDPSFKIQELVNATQGFSGSDLKELCRNAAMTPVREALRSLEGDVKDVDPASVKVRPLRLSDFISVESSAESGVVQGSDGTLSGLDLD
ncbi:hypothetical protein HDV05_008292 [Chytridiales sp. JEL 0842]|nr:hypothetical protein HDV05_008292 [Chytridiales sp. JEL 0842]